jgi:fibronectin type 3 domain-containing protein
MKRYLHIAVASIAIIATIMFWVVVSSAATSSVTLQWDANTEPDLAGYKLYQGAATGGPYTLKQTLAKVTTTTVAGLVDGTHYFVLTAFDTVGNESSYSNEVNKAFETVAPAPPRNVVITITVTVP